jgi:hypothetical protein
MKRFKGCGWAYEIVNGILGCKSKDQETSKKFGQELYQRVLIMQTDKSGLYADFKTILGWLSLTGKLGKGL